MLKLGADQGHEESKLPNSYDSVVRKSTTLSSKLVRVGKAIYLRVPKECEDLVPVMEAKNCTVDLQISEKGYQPRLHVRKTDSRTIGRRTSQTLVADGNGNGSRNGKEGLDLNPRVVFETRTVEIDWEIPTTVWLAPGNGPKHWLLGTR